MLGYSFIDGKVLPTHEARIPIDDVGFMRCYAIYEGITTVGVQPAFLSEHMDRLERSAELLGISLPYTRNEMVNIITELGAYVTTPRGDIRVVLSGGQSADGLTPGEKSAFYAIVNNLAPLPEDLYKKGGKVMTHEHQRFLPECKTTHYTTAAMLQKTKKEHGAIEILYTKNGNVLEAATCNVFIVKNGTLITPEKNILHGITRMKTLEIANKESVPVELRDITIQELLAADEVFLTSSYKDILPITTVDTHIIGAGTVGQLTHRMSEAYQNLLADIPVPAASTALVQ